MRNQQVKSSRRKLYPVVAVTLALVVGFCALVIYSFLRPQISLARQKRTMVDLEVCMKALEGYREKHGGYPGADWESSVRSLVEEELLDEPLLRDHWGNPFVYMPAREVGESLAGGYTLRSCGEDGLCEQKLPVSIGFDHADYASDMVIQDGSWRRGPFGPSRSGQ